MDVITTRPACRPLAVTLVLITCLTLDSIVGGYQIRIGYATNTTGFGEAAISMALDKIQAEGRLLDHTFSFSVRASGMSPRRGMAAHMELVNNDRVDVILGHLYSSVCVPTGYMDTYQNTARFPTLCSDSRLANKADFPTFVRLAPSINGYGPALAKVFVRYGWTKAAFIADTVVPGCALGQNSIKSNLERVNVTETDSIAVDLAAATDMDVRDILIRIKQRTRVVVVCLPTGGARKLTRAVRDLGLDLAEYTFLSYQSFPTKENHAPWIDPDDPLKPMMSSLKQITYASFTEDVFANFESTWRERFTQPPWEGTEIVLFHPYVMFLADASYLYFQILDELLAEGRDYRDGRLVADRARNRVFQGWTGRVVMNDAGRREVEYWLWNCPMDEDSCKPYATISEDIAEMTSPYWGTEDGLPPPDVPACGLTGELCENSDHTVDIVVPLVVAGILATVLALIYHKRQKNKEENLHLMTWKVNYSDLKFTRGQTITSTRSMTSMASAPKSTVSFGSSTMNAAKEQLFTKVALLQGSLVTIKHINRTHLQIDRDLLVDMKTLKDLSHENTISFIGACIDPPNISVLYAYCSKGSLQDILENDDITLDWMFKCSLMRDLINGMCYLHGRSIYSHGSLRSSNCLVDSRWVLKLSGFGLAKLWDGAEVDSCISEDKQHQKLLWTAPELLRLEPKYRPARGTQKGDVYSFAIILQETIHRAAPFFGLENAKGIINRLLVVNEKPYRPVSPHGAGSQAHGGTVELMESCWAEDPSNRPNFSEIRNWFKRANKAMSKDIMDNMISLLEKYASNLEGLVQQRTGELLEEKQKTDLLLHRMLPRSVAELLKVGKTVAPEMYENVTIYFSDIVGFTSLSSSSTPMEVVNLLNDLYTTFDRTIEKYDVYKVETIGDAYMVVSGLPERNDDRHAMEIADMALSLLKNVLTFRIRHRPNQILNLRIGLHTGPCAAGVVGQTMPRYCLFGDTVNMASRMESTGEAQKIHISEATKAALARFPHYAIENRGETTVKGKGNVTTYWLKTMGDCTLNIMVD